MYHATAVVQVIQRLERARTHRRDHWLGERCAAQGDEVGDGAEFAQLKNEPGAARVGEASKQLDDSIGPCRYHQLDLLPHVAARTARDGLDSNGRARRATNLW